MRQYDIAGLECRLPTDPRAPLADPVAGPSAATALWLVAAYDRLRLETYRDRGPRGGSIRVDSIGGATALRFEDVGYFNRIYSADESVADHLAEIEAFYAGIAFHCELVGPAAIDPARSRAGIDRACSRRGWLPGSCYAWVAAQGRALDRAPPSRPPRFEIRPPECSERELFVSTYLRAFEAAPGRFVAALPNMRHLFDLAELSFLVAFARGEPAGVGVLYRAGAAAVLCGGATLPRFRNQGCHTALIEARIRMALDLGCRSVVSWARAGGQSHANMRRAGLSTVGITSAWRFPPSGCGSKP
jgi:hypothetical protein